MARGDRRAPLDGHVAPQPHRRVQSVLSGLDGREPIEKLPRGSPPGPKPRETQTSAHLFCPSPPQEATFHEHISQTWACMTMESKDARCYRCVASIGRSACVCGPFLTLSSCCTPCRKHWADYLNSSFCSDHANRANPSCHNKLLQVWPGCSPLAECEGCAGFDSPQPLPAVQGQYQRMRESEGAPLGPLKPGKVPSRSAVRRKQLLWAQRAIGLAAPPKKGSAWRAGLAHF